VGGHKGRPYERKMLTEIGRRLRMFFRRRRFDADLSEEMRLHRELREREQIERGLSTEEAHYAARRRFGNDLILREEGRDMWGWSWLEDLGQDIRYALRMLRKNPAFTVAAVLTLALGIGANTAIFSVVNSVLLRPLPFQNPERLVDLQETEVAPGDYPLSGPDYLDWQAQNHTLGAISLYGWRQIMSASGAGEPEPAGVVSTQANFFEVMGIRPLLGRGFAPGEDAAGKNHVAVLSYGFWQRRFGASPEAIGKAVELNDEAYTVIGVMPRGFIFPWTPDLWTPLDMTPKALGQRGNHNWSGVGRIKTGITLAQARAELLSISERAEKAYPDTNHNVHAVLIPLQETLVGYSRAPLLLLLGAVTLVLLVACANVANLLLTRATARQREVVLRASLGAGRWRLIRQMLTESVLLALMGAVLGTAGAWWCVRLVNATKTLPIPRVQPVELDASVLLLTLSVSVLAGILFGLAPALHVSKLNLSEQLKTAVQGIVSPLRSGRLLRDALVVGQIAVTLALLVGAGLLLRSFAHLRNTELGFQPHNLLTTTLNLPDAKYPTLAARREFFDQLVDRVDHTPGVDAAAISVEIPLQGGSNGYLSVDGETDPNLASQLVGWNWITPDYFRTFGIPLQSGRAFRPEDLERAEATANRVHDLYAASPNGPPTLPPDLSLVCVISQTAARIFWKNQNPVGRSFHWNNMKVIVLGVVGDVKEYGVRDKIMPQAYFPYTLLLSYGGYGHLTLKTRVPPMSVLGEVRRHVHALDGGLAMFQAQTVEQVLDDNTQDAGIQAFLLGTFATLALLLAVVGLYGVMSYLVAQRTREIGIRMALGAQASSVLNMVMREGLRLSIVGVVLGVAAAIGLTRLMATALYGVRPTDPITYAAMAIVLTVVTLSACWIPARRATKVDPIEALRDE
jgi:putative ABC transport system permease protein